MKTYVSLGVLVLVAMASIARADELDGLRARIESYQAAFNRHDPKGVAEHWSDEGVYEDESGRQARGRDQIAGVFRQLFAGDPRVQLRLQVTSLRAVTRDVVVEEGKAQLTAGDGSAEESTYSAINVKRNGVWYVDSVREVENPKPATAAAAAPSHHEKLKELSWLIGEWVSEGDDSVLHSKCDWTKDGNFISRSFTLRVKDRGDVSGTQVIGWDAAAGRIKCWTFNSDGGTAEGTWSRHGSQWSTKLAITMADGRKGSAVHVITHVNDNTFKWRAVGREVHGEILPNIDEFAAVRVTE